MVPKLACVWIVYKSKKRSPKDPETAIKCWHLHSGSGWPALPRTSSSLRLGLYHFGLVVLLSSIRYITQTPCVITYLYLLLSEVLQPLLSICSANSLE